MVVKYKSAYPLYPTMRLVYFGRYWRDFGGTEFDIRTMLRELAKRGCECIAISYDTEASATNARQPLEEEGVKVFYADVPNLNKVGVPVSIRSDKKLFKKVALSTLISYLDPGDILMTCFPPQEEAWKIAKKRGASIIQKYTVVYDGYEPEKWNPIVDMNIFNSEACRDAWKDRGVTGPNMVIYPEIDMKDVVVAESGDGIGMINPTRHKGSKIFEYLGAEFPDEKFISAGGWAVKPGAVVKRRKNQEYMKHMKDIGDFYRRLKIMLVPTQEQHFETYGRVVLEAMFYGVPVIAANKDGIPEAAEDAAMLVDDYESPEAWKCALKEMLNDNTWCKWKHRAVQRAYNYDLGRMIGRWELALKMVRGGDNSPPDFGMGENE